jgi:prepilin-type N-terminal cleavage/methylation domain-containing protein
VSSVNVKPRSGFTLIELLITTSIIGVIASASTVSYSYIRTKARDVARAANVKTIQAGIETYFEDHGAYPPAPEGIILGTSDAKVISDAGITALGEERGRVYLQGVPSNTEPGGEPFLYLSKNDSGEVCGNACEGYDVHFTLETAVGELHAGPHKLTQEGIQGPETGAVGLEAPPFYKALVPRAEDLTQVVGTAKELAEYGREQVADRPEVQTANKAVVAPVSVVAAGANLVAVLGTVLPAANLGQFLLLLISQPLLIFGRKKRTTWGVVYHAGTKVPIDLASVRLIDTKTGRAAGTKVTDKNGRYAFNPRPGTYRIEVIKPGFKFPAPSLVGVKDDGVYHEIYQGTLIQVVAQGQVVAVNIPVEPEQEATAEVRVLLSEQNKRSLRKMLAMSGPVLGVVAYAITPSTTMLLLLLIHLGMFFGFRRLAEKAEPKTQGIVYQEGSKDPIDKAVVRIFSLPYNKVLESRLTDSRGRYSFYVGNGKYYLTVTKDGYEKTETSELDFTNIEKPTFIASDLPLRKMSVK